MVYKTIDKYDIGEVMSLFCSSFYNDVYYKKMFPNENMRREKMLKDFTPSVEFCLGNGTSLGVFDEGKLIGFIITVQLETLTCNKEMYNSVFAFDVTDENHESKLKLQEKLRNFTDKTIYCVSMAVSERYRRKGLASLLIDYYIKNYSDYNYIADVSNEGSLNIYKKRGFNIEKIGEEYYFVSRKKGSLDIEFNQADSVRLALNSNAELNFLGVDNKLCDEQYILDVAEGKNGYFAYKKGEITLAKIYEISYKNLLKYQKYIGVSAFTERVEIDYLYYLCNDENYHAEKISEEYLSFLQKRDVESKICPDVFISIPISYADSGKFIEGREDELAKLVLRNLDFRTKYEAGIISNNRIERGNSAFKNRIKRVYLGKIKIKTCGDTTIYNYDDYYFVGQAYYLDMYVSYDEFSRCGVIGLYSMSCPFLISLFFDNIVRNQVVVLLDEENLNLFDYLEAKYAIRKSGSPKIYSAIPEDRDIMDAGQIGSLLSGEMIYEDGENFGKIIDSDIIDIVKSPLGMGQYNRGCVLAYMNVVLQFDKQLKGSLADRVAEEIITQFYIELIIFEEAAINSTNDAITDLLGNSLTLTPIGYLKAVDKIQDDYSKTMCFWNITLNYPTSQKSVGMIRNAFRVENQLEKLERNKRQLEEVFDTKNDIIDREEDKRVNSSLAVLSCLTIASALIDCFDFIGVWQRFLPERAVSILQIVFSIIIGVIGFKVIWNITLGKFIRKLKFIKNKNRR